jgi:hypothetical protein
MGTKQYVQLLKKYFHIPDIVYVFGTVNLDALNEDMVEDITYHITQMHLLKIWKRISPMVEDITYHITQMHLLKIWKRISPSIFDGAKYINDDGNLEVLFQ